MSEQQIDDLTVFARLDAEGVVLEYPVFALHIRNRAQPFDWYTQVEFDPKPEVPQFFSLCETITVSRSLTGVFHVKASYTLKADSLASVLNTLRKPSEIPGTISDEPLDFADVPPATVLRVSELATALAQSKLDGLAQTRNYDSINSAASYKGSKVARFGAEGQRAFDLRDDTYQALYTYIGKVQSGELPVPLTVEEIEANLPAMTWDA